MTILDRKHKNKEARDNGVTIITAGCHFNGKLYCRGSSRIAGRIEGQIISEGMLVIEETAEIEADIKADEVIIQGKVKGTLEAKGRLELCSTAVFSGELCTTTLIVKDGAEFNGASKMLTREEMEKAASKTDRVAEISQKARDVAVAK